MILIFNQLPIQSGSNPITANDAFNQKSSTASAEVNEVVEWRTLNP